MNRQIYRETARPIHSRTKPLEAGETRDVQLAFEKLPEDWNSGLRRSLPSTSGWGRRPRYLPSRITARLSSPSYCQASSEKIRQAGLDHLFLSFLQIVGGADVFHPAIFAVEQGESGAPVAVSRLPHRPGFTR